MLVPAVDVDAAVMCGADFLRSTEARMSVDDVKLTYRRPAEWSRIWSPPVMAETGASFASGSHARSSRSRRTDRSFDCAPVADDVITEVAREAMAPNELASRPYPSAGGLYPVKVFLLKAGGRVAWIEPDLGRVMDVAGAQFSAGMCSEDLEQSMAPHAFILCIDVVKVSRRYLGRGIRYAFMEAGALAMVLEENLRERGLGVFWIGGFDDAQVRASVDPEGGLHPALILAFGRPAA